MKTHKVNQAAVAKATGVSRSTVSFALNERLAARVNPETRMHILRTAERLGYRPNRVAQTMRSGRSYTIGLLHYMGIIQPVIERVTFAAGAIQKAGYQPHVVDMHWFPGRETLSLDLLLGVHVDGLIISDPTASIHRFLKKTEIPTVFLSEPTGVDVPFVCSDLAQGMQDVTRHALALGHRKLALMLPCEQGEKGRGGSSGLAKREHGFVRAIESAGGTVMYERDLSLSEASVYQKFLKKKGEAGGITGCVVSCPVTHSLFNPYQAGADMMHLIARHQQFPDIALFSNDHLGLGAMDYCRRNGIKVPEQMAITGFDNTAVSRIAPVGLTTVEQPNQAIAERAVSLLIHLLNGEKLSEEERQVRIPCTPVIRESCGSPQGIQNAALRHPNS